MRVERRGLLDELVTRLVNDALSVLDAVDGVELDDDQTQLVGLLVAVEPDTGLITACELTPANDGDGPIGEAPCG